MSDRSMRAARFHGGATGLRLEDVPWPVAGPGEVVVRVAACGICGSDVHFLEGMPVPAALPLTLGHEPAGVVEAVGANVKGWKPGDRVAIHLGVGCGSCATCKGGSPSACRTQRSPGLHLDGAFAEAIRIPASNLVRVPDNVSLAAAALATDCVTSPYHALACRGRLVAGERVAVIGAGGLGGVAVRLAKILGAGQVIAVDLSSVALERAAKLGADECVRIGKDEDPSLKLNLLTQGGADLVIECVGRPETVAAGVRALRPGGRLVVVGVGMQPPRIDLPQALFCVGELSVIGSFASHIEDLATVLRLEEAGLLDIEASISHRLPLERVAEGLEMLRTKSGDPQRIVVEMEL
jgi:2-desacetyl-2-hydroxyethyl bacteriochlorophyllide A dehydrogenase